MGRQFLQRSTGLAQLGLGAAVLALFASSASASAQSPLPAEPQSAIFHTTGPFVVRVAENAEIDATVPTFDSSGAAQPLRWRPVFRLRDHERADGWYLSQFVCDANRNSLCLIEKRKDEEVHWRMLDLESGAALTAWTEGQLGMVMDFDSANQDLILGLDELGPSARIELRSLASASSPGTALWTRNEGADHAYGRFLMPSLDGRPILLMNGGYGIQWRIVDASGRAGEVIKGPGTLAAVLHDTLIFTSQSADREKSWIGSRNLPATGEPWPQNTLILAGGTADAPPLGFESREWRLWRPEQPIAFTASGTLLALTRTDAGLGLSEVCRPTDRPQDIVARPVDAPGLDLTGGVAAELHGGMPGSGIALLTVTSVLGQNKVWALIDASLPGAGPSPLACGASLRVMELGEPRIRPELIGVRAEKATVTSDDGLEIEYTIIGHPERRGRVMVRPYGAAGLVPNRFLSTPFERSWVAAGNSLVIPQLRGDQGTEAWIRAGQGDHKRRTVDDLFHVIDDLHRRYPDLDRVDLVGVSAGGYLVAKAALERPNLFRRVVMISAALDHDLEGRPARGDEFGPAEGGFAAWFGDRPAGEGEQPLFVVLHGSADQNAVLEGATAFAAFARRLGYVVRGQSYEGVGHDLAGRSDLTSDIEALSRPPN